MKKRLLSLTLAAIMALGVMTGCSSSSSTTESTTTESTTTEAATTEASGTEGKHIAFMVKNTNSEYWITMINAVEERCAEYGWTVDILAPIVAESNEEQIQLIEQALINPPDLFCIVPADSAGITPAIEAINDAGIPVINVNTMFFDEEIECLTFVGIENYDAGVTIAEGALELLPDGGNVLLLEGTTGSQTSIDRMAGAWEVFNENPQMVILDSQPANFARVEAMTVTQNLLQKYPDVDLIWSAAGEMAIGAAEALTQAGRSDTVQNVTMNGFSDMIMAYLDGRVTLTYDDAPHLQGSTAIDLAYAYFNGETVDRYNYIDMVRVDESNIDSYIEMYDLYDYVESLG